MDARDHAFRDAMDEKEQRAEAAKIRESILQGLRDLIEGRVLKYEGDLRAVLKNGTGKM